MAQDKEKDDEKNGKDNPIPQLPKAIPANPVVPPPPQGIPDAPVQVKPVEEGLGKLTPEAVKGIKDKKRRRKAEEALAAQDLAEKTAKKAADKNREVRMDAALADARAQKEIEKKLMKDAGAPGGLEKLLTYATGGIFGAVSGAYSRQNRGVQDVENFRAALKQQRALTGAKTTKAVNSLAAAQKTSAGYALATLGQLSTTNGWIDKDGTVPSADGGRVVWWGGLPGMDPDWSSAEASKYLTRQIKRLAKNPTKTDALGNVIPDLSSEIFIKAASERLKQHNANWEKQEGYDHTADEEAAVKVDLAITAMGRNAVGSDGKVKEPPKDSPLFYTTDGKPTRAFYTYMAGGLNFAVDVNEASLKQVNLKAPDAIGDYKKLMRSFGQYGFDAGKWFRELSPMSKVYVTSPDNLKRMKEFNLAAQKNVTLLGAENALLGHEENPFRKIAALQKQIANVQRKKANTPEEANANKIELAVLTVEYEQAESETGLLHAKLVSDNKEFEEAKAAAKAKGADMAKFMANRTVTMDTADINKFRKLIPYDRDEGEKVDGLTLWEATFTEEVELAGQKYRRLKPLFQTFLTVDYQSLPLGIHKGVGAAAELTTGLTSGRSNWYTPEAQLFERGDEGEQDFRPSGGLLVRNPRMTSEEQRREINRVRGEFRKAGKDLDFHDYLISPNIQTVFNSPEQMAAIAARLKGSEITATENSTKPFLIDTRDEMLAEWAKATDDDATTAPDKAIIKIGLATFLRAWEVHEYNELTLDDILEIR